MYNTFFKTLLKHYHIKMICTFQGKRFELPAIDSESECSYEDASSSSDDDFGFEMESNLIIDMKPI